jgi:hypothetical protein
MWLLGYSLACCALAACGKKGGEASAAVNEETTAHAVAPPPPVSEATCALPKEPLIHQDLVVKAGCIVDVARSYEVQSGATLTIEPGAKLRFATSTRVMIQYGKLVAKGEKDRPVVFTSANAATPVAGEWEGIVFGERTKPGSVLEHVVIEYAGRRGGLGGGAVTLFGAVKAGTLAIVRSTIRESDQAAVQIAEAESQLAAFEGNVLSHNGLSLSMPAEVMRSIGANTFGDPIAIHGPITAPQTWPALDAPVIASGDVRFGAHVTMAPKTTVKVEAKARLWIGGGLAATEATFTSASAKPAPGDWAGIGVAEGANVALDGCLFEYAGAETAVVMVKGDPAKVGIVRAVFRNNAKPAFSAAGACGSLVEEKSGNVSEGADLCAATGG